MMSRVPSGAPSRRPVRRMTPIDDCFVCLASANETVGREAIKARTFDLLRVMLLRASALTSWFD